MPSFPRKRESNAGSIAGAWIPAFAGMTASLTRGGPGKMLAKEASIYHLAMQTSCFFEVCGLAQFRSPSLIGYLLEDREIAGIPGLDNDMELAVHLGEHRFVVV